MLSCSLYNIESFRWLCSTKSKDFGLSPVLFQHPSTTRCSAIPASATSSTGLVNDDYGAISEGLNDELLRLRLAVDGHVRRRQPGEG